MKNLINALTVVGAATVVYLAAGATFVVLEYSRSPEYFEDAGALEVLCATLVWPCALADVLLEG